MNTIRSILNTLYLSGFALTGGLLAMPQAAHASQQDGVQCPAGSTVRVSADKKVLHCLKRIEIQRPAFCSPVNFDRRASLDINARIEHHKAGKDYCSDPSGQVRAPAQFLPLPGDPPAHEFQQVAQAGTDVFRAFRMQYVFPEGGPVYNPLHNPNLGVSCPSGYEGERTNGDGIRCKRDDGRPVVADCDVLWTRIEDRDGLVDRCVGPNEGPTKPRGMTKVQHDLDRGRPDVAWYLDKNRGGDHWQRVVFTYPRSSN